MYTYSWVIFKLEYYSHLHHYASWVGRASQITFGGSQIIRQVKMSGNEHSFECSLPNIFSLCSTIPNERSPTQKPCHLLKIREQGISSRIKNGSCHTHPYTNKL